MVPWDRKESAEAGRLFRCWVGDVRTVERKALSDLVHSCTVDRRGFIDRMRAMARLPHRLLVRLNLRIPAPK